MTYNQIIKRIQTIVLAHKQIRNFYQGLVQDFLTEKTARYASCFLQDTTSVISLSGHQATFGFRIFFLDLVHVSQDSKENEQDVQSDMISIALDVFAQMNFGSLNDWSISDANNIVTVTQEYDNDMLAGCYVDFSVGVPYDQNVCQIPTDLFITSGDNPGSYGSIDMKVYDLEYISDGNEGATLSIPALIGKKILLILRENAILYKVSSSPDSTEYIWNGTVFTLGLAITSVQRFIILYRNY